ncbi:MAG TPA: TolC family protein, partial [Phycisphaerales bacterium]|nr:TolC family protein [Phycisphaerales bacterium]
TQPLLRDAWPEVNLARMRIASINESASRSAFRAKVEDVVTTVVTTYWSLRQARRDLEIQQWLLDEARA